MTEELSQHKPSQGVRTAGWACACDRVELILCVSPVGFSFAWCVSPCRQKSARSERPKVSKDVRYCAPHGHGTGKGKGNETGVLESPIVERSTHLPSGEILVTAQ
eukprot:5529036-Pyramimonas_sp.AAC.1